MCAARGLSVHPQTVLTQAYPTSSDGALLRALVGNAGLTHTHPHPHSPPLAQAYPTSNGGALLRALVGNAGLLGLFEGVAALTPRQPIPVYAALRFLKCASPLHAHIYP